MLRVQRDHIRNYLVDLQQFTDCNTIFLAYLQSKYVISEIDAESLKVINNRFERAALFYEIIVKRHNSFDVLREALDLTLQTGALAILNGLGNSA